MFKKIPLLLWLFQVISLLAIVLHSVGFFMYFRELLMSFSFTNLLGTTVNLTSLSLLVFIIIGIWKQKKKARIGVIVYSFIFLFGVLYGSMKAYSNMETYQPDGLGTFIVSHSIWTIAFLAFSISLVISRKVKEFF